jgi:hypothetical protein
MQQQQLAFLRLFAHGKKKKKKKTFVQTTLTFACNLQ